MNTTEGLQGKSIQSISAGHRKKGDPKDSHYVFVTFKGSHELLKCANQGEKSPNSPLAISTQLPSTLPIGSRMTD